MKTPTARRLPSGSWCCRVMVDGKSQCITMPTEKEAIAEAMAVKAGIRREQERARTGDITLREAIDKYIEDRYNVLSPSTIRGYRTVQRNRLQLIMDSKISRIDTKAIQRAINQDAAEVGRKTITNAIGLVSGVLGYQGITIGKLTIPTTNKGQAAKPLIYNRDQLETLLKGIKGKSVELPVLLAAWLGLRRSEIVGLKWSAVDFDNQTITIEAALVPDEHGHYVEKGTKTEASNRTLECPQYIMEVLRRTERTGEHIITVHPSTVAEQFRRLCADLGLPCYGLHRLRHQMASTLLALNIPDKEVMELGGWSNVTTPKKIYQHTQKDGITIASAARDGYYYALLEDRRRLPLSPGGVPRQKQPKRFKVINRSKKSLQKSLQKPLQK